MSFDQVKFILLILSKVYGNTDPGETQLFFEELIIWLINNGLQCCQFRNACSTRRPLGLFYNFIREARRSNTPWAGQWPHSTNIQGGSSKVSHELKILNFIASSNVDWFSKFFHWHTQQYICNRAIIKDPILAQILLYTT